MDFLKRQNPRIVIFVVVLFLIGGYQALFAPPADFPSGSIVSIERGASAPIVASQLAAAHIIVHPSLLRLFLRLSGTSASVEAGAYRFETPQNLLVIAYRMAMGVHGIPTVRVTFPEGVTVRETAMQIADALPGISQTDFLKKAKPYEGYLFPDTYLFPPSSDATSIIALMRENFNTKIAALSGEINSSGHTLSDIVIVASLVEREARASESKRIVAGILYNRLKIGMPLQVDAVFGYIFERATYSPSFADLKIDSPYNTYTHKGLPPGPISNPGLDSLQAAIHPTKTDYVYYITGKDNRMHYATTYVGHQSNLRTYLH